MVMRYALKYITKLAWIGSLLTAILTFPGCKNDPPVFPDPSIRFVTGPGFLSQDTVALLNESFRIGLSANTGSDEALTHLHITIVKDSLISAIDTALFTNHLDYEREVTKGMAKNESWKFYVRDRDGRKSSEIVINIKLDAASTYASIQSIASVRLSAQNTSTPGSFYSFDANQSFSLSEAFANQSLVNILYYFDEASGDKNTVASPGANVDPSIFQGTEGLAAWTLRNVTRFNYQGNILPGEFDQCRNDSLILANTFEFETGKRKAKNLEKNQIYSFVTDSGRKGLFKVIEVPAEQPGILEISIKIKK